MPSSTRTGIRPSRSPRRQKSGRSDASVASAARTANGTSPTFAIAAARAIHADIVSTVVTGTTPTLRVALEVSMDGGTTWYEADKTQADMTAASTQRKSFDASGGTLGRWRYDIAGTTPSFTFKIDASEILVSR